MSQAALFVSDGERFVPTDRARGPWTPDAMHGGPVAALVAHAAEHCEPSPQMAVCRLTVELLRPVPLRALEVRAELVRPGRKVQLVEVHVVADGTEVAGGRALRIRSLDPSAPAAAAVREVVSSLEERGVDGPVPPGPDEGEPSPPLVEGYQAFHNAGAELRFVRGSFGQRGPATVWVRLKVPVVQGEEPSPVERVAAAADFGNGVSSVLDYSNWIFINPDLSVVLSRPPVGEWICLEASTGIGPAGAGVASSVVRDTQGVVGMSYQSLLVEPR